MRAGPPPIHDYALKQTNARRIVCPSLNERGEGAVTCGDLINWPELRNLSVGAHLSIKNLPGKKPGGSPASEARHEKDILPGIPRRQRCSGNRGSGHAGYPFCKSDFGILAVVTIVVSC